MKVKVFWIHLLFFFLQALLNDLQDFFAIGFMSTLCPVVGKGSKEVYTSVIKINDSHKTKTLSTVATEPYKLCPCSGNGFKCNVSEHPEEIQAYPGETFYVSLVAVGQFNHPSPATIFSEVCLTSRVCIYNKELHIGAQQRIQLVGKKCERIPYTIYTAKSSAVIQISIQHESFVAKASKSSSAGTNKNNTAYIIHVNLLPCPLGFQLSTDLAQCKCAKHLTLKGVKCDINTRNLHKPLGSWIGRENNVTKTILFHTYCPFNYCKNNDTSVSLQSPDEQCAFNRSGILCGSCKPGLSLALGTSQCLQCPNTYLLLIIPFALAGVGLVLLLLKCNLTVSVGTINGLIFYANIVRANQAIFFPNGTRSSILSVFIAWVNLDVGIETCFFHGMNTNVKAWLQFAFPIYVCGIVILLTILGQYSSVVSKLTGSNVVSVMATIFLLSYAKILRSVITAVSFTHLVYPDETQHAVWLHNGNVKLFTAQHSLLCGFALILFLFYIVPLTISVVLAPSCLQARHNRYCRRLLRWLHKLRPLLDAYQQPYKDKFRNWPGVLLMVRMVLFVTFACNTNGNPSLNLVAIIITLIVLLLLCWSSRRVYKNYLLGIIESFFFVNLGILSTFTLFLNSPLPESEDRSLGIVNISVGLSFVVFCIILVYHCHQHLRMTFALSRIVAQVKKHSLQSTQQNLLPYNGSSEEWDGVTECTAQNAVTFTVVELSELSTSETYIQQHDAERWNPETVIQKNN